MQDLIAIPGIGAVTARALVEAGIADVAALAQVDPAAPPTEAAATLPRPDWPAWVAAARAAVGADGGDPNGAEPSAAAGDPSGQAPAVADVPAAGFGGLVPPEAGAAVPQVARVVLDRLHFDGALFLPGDEVALTLDIAATLDAERVTAAP